jgi:hypothetical protein
MRLWLITSVTCNFHIDRLFLTTYFGLNTGSPDRLIMKNAVFCDINTHFVLHRRHIASLLQNLAG